MLVRDALLLSFDVVHTPAAGWNILYDFAQSDISICTLQLKIFLDDYEHIPYKVLQYLFSEVNYGGRITDDKDRRLNNNILESFICKESLAKHCKLSPSGASRRQRRSTSPLPRLISASNASHPACLLCQT